MKKNTRTNEFGTTDYDIPVFSIKSAILIVGVTMGLTVLVSYITTNIWARNLTIALSLSFTTAYSRFFLDTKRGMGKRFWMTVLLIFAACFLVLCFIK